MNNLSVNFIPQVFTNYPTQKSVSTINFCSREGGASDVFERQVENNTKILNFSIYNPNSCRINQCSVDIDFNKPKIFELNDGTFGVSSYSISYDPQRTGLLFDKKTGEPIKVAILKSTYSGDEYAYHFMSQDLKKEYGYVEFMEVPNPEEFVDPDFAGSNIYKDYPEYGIKGGRVLVEYLKNWKDREVGGVGVLADKMIVKHCVERGLNPIIVSDVEDGSHVAHYLRGKRFLPLKKDSDEAGILELRYGMSNLNKIIEQELARNKDDNPQHIKLPLLIFTTMYMPQELVQKYIEEIEAENF